MRNCCHIDRLESEIPKRDLTCSSFFILSPPWTTLTVRSFPQSKTPTKSVQHSYKQKSHKAVTPESLVWALHGDFYGKVKRKERWALSHEEEKYLSRHQKLFGYSLSLWSFRERYSSLGLASRLWGLKVETRKVFTIYTKLQCWMYTKRSTFSIFHYSLLEKLLVWDLVDCVI